MEYIVAAFRSRAETVRFYEFLKSNGFTAGIINTPKEAGVGCGLSVKIPVGAYSLVSRAARFFPAKSFAGFFSVKTVGGRRVVKSV